MTAPYIIAYVPQCKLFEGEVSWFYLDTAKPKANVTVGVGFLVPDLATACALPMCLPDGVTAATDEQITEAFTRVSQMAPGKLPAFYAYPGALVMPGPAIDAKLLVLLEGLDGQLAGHFAGWAGYPDQPKLAMLDMAYELGFSGLIDGYPRFCAAVEQNNWATCAAECFRNGPSLARNNWTRNQLLAG